MIVGGPALQLDATLFSTLRTHRVPSPPLATPVVKLYAIVRNMVNPYDPSDDSPRFEHRVAQAVAAGIVPSPESQTVSSGSSCAGDASLPSSPVVADVSSTPLPDDATPGATVPLHDHSNMPVTSRERNLRRFQDDTRSAYPVTVLESPTEVDPPDPACGLLDSSNTYAEVFAEAKPPKKPRLSSMGDVPSASSWVKSPQRFYDPEHPHGKDLYEEDEGFDDMYDFCQSGQGEEGGRSGVEQHRSGGEKWNVWHHGGDDQWENHVASCASYGVLLNGFTWSFEEYDARLEAGLVSEDPKLVCLPVAPYEKTWYEWKPCATGDDNGGVDEFLLTQTSLTACLSAPGGSSATQENNAGKTTKNDASVVPDASGNDGKSEAGI